MMMRVINHQTDEVNHYEVKEVRGDRQSFLYFYLFKNLEV